ncbi:hypothetical protein [Arthrobacter sp. B0490]|uniref:hypothetical protein n=1 Tax=Arthrobacter sp. B0490 TaxID=2058891 RepID=UPI000CE482F5|nr:hypothetical protein [Arthrobacter sp. B0490]
MDSGAGAAACEPGAAASGRVEAMAAALRWHAGQLEGIRHHALSVSLLAWESPAGTAFTVYLAERCTELSRTVDLLESAAGELGVYGGLLREAELLQAQGAE